MTIPAVVVDETDKIDFWRWMTCRIWRSMGEGEGNSAPTPAERTAPDGGGGGESVASAAVPDRCKYFLALSQIISINSNTYYTLIVVSSNYP